MTIYILGAFLLSLICGAFFTPAILDYCKRNNLYDIPSERKIHTKAIPRLGGISFLPSMILAFAIILLFLSNKERNELPINIWSASYIVGLFIIYITGIVDDLVGLKAQTKFIAQIAAASLLPLTGLYVNNLYGLFGIEQIPSYVGIPLTVFIIVFVDNAINLIDGIDGLAGSVSLLALGGFLAYFIHHGAFTNTYTILVAGMMGALVAFLYFNLFGSSKRNTKIFMGDSGSLSLGFTLGFLTVKCVMHNLVIWPLRPEALLIPVTLLFVPTADVVRVTLYRMRHHKPLFDADKNHIHHKLMRAGLNQHQTLLFIVVFMLVLTWINYLLYPGASVTAIIGIDVAAYCLLNTVINQTIDKHYLSKSWLGLFPGRMLSPVNE